MRPFFNRSSWLDYAFAFVRLLWQLGVRDIQTRYKGSVLGIFWAIITPLLTVALYTFLFSVVFHSQWGENMSNPALKAAQASPAESQGSSHGQYALILFAGLILYSFLADVMSRATSIVVGQSNLVKKVVFPLHVLPAVVVFSALFQLFVSSLLLVACLLWAGEWNLSDVVHASWLSLPLVLLPLVFWGLGLSCLLASLGVYLRDLSQVMGWIVTALMFSAPILYPIANIAKPFQVWLYLNPLTWVVETWRHVMYWGIWPNWNQWTMALGVGLVFAAFGAWVFERLKKGFADVL